MAKDRSTTSPTAGTELDERIKVRRGQNIEEDDPDYTSSSGTSSSEDVDDETSYEEEPSPGVRSGLGDLDVNSALRSRLAAFLPELERSNRELETASNVHARRIDEVDDHAEHYVEMNLSMGVLSERSPQDGMVKTKDHSSEEDTSDDDNDSSEQREDDTEMTLRTKVKNKGKVEELV